MPTIEVSEETYRNLEREAARQSKTVQEVVATIPEKVYPYPFPPTPSPEEITRMLEEISERAKARALLYPPGFELDISRESMYE